MTIKATRIQINEALNALTAIGEERIGEKGMYRVARLQAKLTSLARAGEAARQKIWKNEGGVVNGNSMYLRQPVKKEGETPEAFHLRMVEHDEKLTRIQDAQDAHFEEEEEISYDPIPVELLKPANPEKDAEGKEKKFGLPANVLAPLIDLFLVEKEEPKSTG